MDVCTHVCSPRVSFSSDIADQMVKRSLQRTLSLQSAQEMTLSLCYPRVLKRGSTLSFEFASSRGTSQQIKACPLLCFTKTLWCVCVLVCVNCWLLSSQQLYISICVLCFAERGRLYACVRRSCEPVCVNGLSPLALALRVCTR